MRDQLAEREVLPPGDEALELGRVGGALHVHQERGGHQVRGGFRLLVQRAAERVAYL